MRGRFGRFPDWSARALARRRPRPGGRGRTPGGGGPDQPRAEPRPEGGPSPGSRTPEPASRLSPIRRLSPPASLRSVAGQVFVMQFVLVMLLIAVLTAVVLVESRRDNLEEARQRSLAVAETFAQSPGLAAAMTGEDPAKTLQPRAERARRGAGVDLVVVYSPDGVRYTHPDPELIGERVPSPGRPPAKALTQVVGTAAGTSVVARVPVTMPGLPPLGTVAVGITVENVDDALGRRLPVILGTAIGGLVLATGSAALFSKRLRRQTHGLGPAEMTRMYEHHDAVLHAVREGVLITGGGRRLQLVNDEARRLLDLPTDAEGQDVSELGMDPKIAELLLSGRIVTDEVFLVGDRLLAVNTRNTTPYGGPSGIVATLRDSTDLRALTGMADVAHRRLKLLYDAGVGIGNTLDVVRTAEELAEVAVPRFADFVTVDLLEPVLSGEEPTEADTDMRRTVVLGADPDQPFFPAGEVLRYHPTSPMAAAVAAGRALLEPDLTTAVGWQAQDPVRAREILDHGVRSLVTVPLRARGIVLGMANFYRKDASEPFGEEDLSFTEELVARAAVCIDNARRYTREHTMAITLQRSLLPHALPEQSGLEVAFRYLPAQAGVGGDWFDVIPLPGARVALVVGDVVGHGLHAAATMGRLSTAVRNFSTLDLPPDEILSSLDELVDRIDQDEAADGSGQDVTGATCLYAIYDPATGRVVVARAGHPGPVVVCPDGRVEFPDVPVSPPLGLGNHPFETTELQVPEGARLVLFTDGLIEDRDRDVDSGLELLRHALARADGTDRTPEQTCQAVFDTMLPTRTRDDIALLVARTRRLSPGQVAEWDVPPDPAAVSAVRAECGRRLQEWGLEEVAFSTELILSELITNAIRYGGAPIRVRLLRDRSLICEVSDGSSTSPRLRRAATTDEGGRGLFLVAQFSERWGTRYTPEGKVIWTEQPVHGGTEADAGEALGRSLMAGLDDEPAG